MFFNVFSITFITSMVLSIVEATAKRNAASGFFVLNVYKIDKQKTFS